MRAAHTYCITPIHPSYCRQKSKRQAYQLRGVERDDCGCQ